MPTDSETRTVRQPKHYSARTLPREGAPRERVTMRPARATGDGRCASWRQQRQAKAFIIIIVALSQRDKRH